MWLHLFFIIFCAKSLWSAGVHYGDSDPLKDSLKVPGVAKIRVWLDHGVPVLGKVSVGHVSLETNSCYLSGWPSSCEGEVFSVPALLVRNYETDYAFENNTPPDAVFILEADTEAINGMVYHYMNCYANVKREEGTFLSDDIQWYSLGNRTPTKETEIESGKQYFNCASFVAVALCLGKCLVIDDKEPHRVLGEEKTQAIRDVFQQCCDSLEFRPTAESFFSRVATFLYPDIILPRDLYDVLRYQSIADTEKLLRCDKFHHDDAQAAFITDLTSKKLKEDDAWRTWRTKRLEQEQFAESIKLKLAVPVESSQAPVASRHSKKIEKSKKKNKSSCVIL